MFAYLYNSIQIQWGTVCMDSHNYIFIHTPAYILTITYLHTHLHLYMHMEQKNKQWYRKNSLILDEKMSSNLYHTERKGFDHFNAK